MGINKSRELRPELLGINVLDPYFSTSTAARKAMMATHLGQAPVVEGSEPRRIFSGAEFHAAEDVFDIRFPCHASIIAVVRKYQSGGMGYGAIPENPVTTIIYKDYYSKNIRVGVIHVPKYLSFHQDFGYPLKLNREVWDRLAPKQLFEKDTVIATSPAVKEDGSYGLGVNAPTIFLTDPGTIEDGIVMSESMCKKMSPRGYGTLVGSWGKKTFPLNLHGDSTHYKPFPDIGDIIPADGLVMAFRDIDQRLGVADMTPRATRTVDHSYDKPLWGRPGAKVVDVKVYHDDRLNPSFTPVGMDTHARKYYDGLATYYRTIMKIYLDLQRSWGKHKLELTPEFGSLIVEAQTHLPVSPSERKLTRMNRLETLDEWRVEITYEWVMPFNEGYKLTDKFGGKGVNCKTRPDHEMPKDKNGNRADIVIYGISTINRTNLGRWFEQFTNAAFRDLVQRMRRECGLDHLRTPTSIEAQRAVSNKEWVSMAFNRLLRFYYMTVPRMAKTMEEHPNPAEHLKYILIDGGYLHHMADNPISEMDQVRNIMKSEFKPLYDKVTYYNNFGEEVESELPALIGDIYFITLEKNGEDYSAAASVKVQHFGVPAKLSQNDRNTTPARQTSVRGIGESESRSLCSTIGPEPTIEIMDQSNNPEAHRFGIMNILTHPTPTNIERLVDRNKVPFGGSRPVNLFKHILASRGLRLFYKPNQED
jgi:hypothetical protein